ncbi:MAG: hypothetical protein A2900_05175 [Candidatus Chisholmbacteria bacterium RIFCSPLOWO2_01_FULL_50_28]|uniref:Uncharacterized protein n=1 Tax=Candidatus Chisholmbacteria bacterium RIFCSPHIGHO2_01_FULL_52_32 TaxID=1797591 RepID=A0A1G1VS10_9BACT|nr:MAG: hypothetical protein A2786_01565 [Candidatus Chisholmbacteria bacterium RIFCSPHIGHO2_01_FULL_52_32]OGY20440.1 MAG: hypothetical protein A2900_05175 [Candidatus Chisholmbacteria bacterium RIFCSPLOWO2_01_FULL_50_28]
MQDGFGMETKAVPFRIWKLARSNDERKRELSFDRFKTSQPSELQLVFEGHFCYRGRTMEGLIEGILSGKENRVGLGGLFSVSSGERVFVGSDPGSVRQPGKGERSIVVKGLPERTLSRLAVELSLNPEGNLRVVRGSGSRKGKRYLPQNSVDIWGRDRERGIWEKQPLGVLLAEQIWAKFDGEPVVVDINVPFPGGGKGIVRLNSASTSRGEHARWEFRVETVEPRNADLNSRAISKPRPHA